ncbi:hypothetical protein PHYBOEH_007940 [Phytophthora boehmeriae]|uniref:Uncharacterized protein n=1 Tax=Phytophthora boehmeriae TaxID=109152 RepID=A0A8T1X0W2_9STRA|nr:hypothetical protein PHYBOEH_007940 [Phytophthora boehmeriae]
MGKATHHNIAAQQEFAKLEILLAQTATDAINCLKVLKGNLAEYDSRHGLHFANTSKSFMRSEIRGAKDSASELRDVANQISKSKTPSEWEISAARSKMNATSDALTDLKKVARSYDEKNGKQKGITAMIDNVLVGNHSKEKESKDAFFNKGSKDKEGAPGSEWFGSSSNNNDINHGGAGILGAADTVEAVVKSTLRDSFGGFSALKHQISTAEKSLSPSFVDRAKEAVAGMTSKLSGESTSSPTRRKGKRNMSM